MTALEMLLLMMAVAICMLGVQLILHYVEKVVTIIVGYIAVVGFLMGLAKMLLVPAFSYRSFGR